MVICTCAISKNFSLKHSKMNKNGKINKMSRNNNCDVLTELTMHILRYLDTAMDTDPFYYEYTQLFRVLGP